MKLVFTQPALERIAEIQAFWAERTSEDRAEALIHALLKKAQRLRTHPLSGFPEPKLAALALGHRSLLLGKFKIVYYVTTDEIRITDFFDTRQHPSRMRG